MSIEKEKADWNIVSSDEVYDETPLKLDKFFNEVIRLLRKIAGE